MAAPGHRVRRAGAALLGGALALSGLGGAAAQTQCSGGNAIGISIDASGSVVNEFAGITQQIADFIDSTSEVDTAAGANSNLYYVNTFSTFLEETTGDFASNAGAAVSDDVLLFTASGGGTNIGEGLDDLTAAYSRLTASLEGVAIIFTDGQDFSRLDEANMLRAEGVTVAAVGIGTVNMFALEEIASERADGSEIIFTGDDFDAISQLFSDVIQSIDTDGDGVDNCNDGCPSDPNKTDPGECGCGVPEGCDDSDKVDEPEAVEPEAVEPEAVEPEADAPEADTPDVDMRGMPMMPDMGPPGSYGV